MDNPNRKHLIALWLLSAFIFSLQSCDDPGAQLEKSKVQFALNPGSTSQGRSSAIELPENSTLRLNIESSSGTAVISNHEIQVSRVGEAYMAAPIELAPGRYVITDFMIVKDGEVLNVSPKAESPLGSFVANSLPYSFSVAQNGVARMDMQVLDARKQEPEAFGYTSFNVKTKNNLSFMVSSKAGGQASMRRAIAELRKGKDLVKRLSVKPGMNRIDFEGEQDATYTLSVYAGEMANARTFNLQALKKELGTKPLRMTLEPALLLTIESYYEETDDYEEYFELLLDGTRGSVKVNWGDGSENTYRLPLSDGSHKYEIGSYTAVITGDLNQITNLHGFSYSTVIMGIKGLTNLTALKTYNPSWGAVPIKVNLSNCKQLETIHVEKYGAPYEPADLRTDFRLPQQHFIKEFLFHAPSFDINREYISAEELDVFVNNIYNNTVRRSIYGGRFIVYPVATPSPEAQAKLDILQNDYNWEVNLDGRWEDIPAGGRTRQDLEARRENWLRENMPGSKLRSRSAKMALTN